MSMSSPLREIIFDAETLRGLRASLSRAEKIQPADLDPLLFERIAVIGIAAEIGTVNDELTPYLFDAESGTPIAPGSVRRSIIEWKGLLAVRVWSVSSPRLELRIDGLERLTHPALSYADDGSLSALHFFPTLIARILALEGVGLAIAREWALRTVFTPADPERPHYRTSLWELERNDGHLLADLVRGGSLTLLGTHDLVAHVAGVRAKAWTTLLPRAERLASAIRSAARDDSLASLVMPYLAGVVLDDLAQPTHYDSESHLRVFDALCRSLERRECAGRNANAARQANASWTTLVRFPREFQLLLEASRNHRVGEEEINALVGSLEAFLRSNSLSIAG